PEGTTKEQVPEMLQALLAERFQLKIHRENREHNVYGLVVGKGGHKLKESPPDADTPATAGDEPKGATSPANGTVNLGNGTQVRIDARNGGATVTSAQNGPMKMSMSPD